MGKFVNPWAYPRPAVKRETRTFTDPAHPEAPVELTFRDLNDATLRLRVGQRAEELMADYLPQGDRPPRHQLPIPDGGEDVTLNEATLRNVAAFEVMQVPGEGEMPYSFADWVGFAVVFPDLFMQVVVWASGLMVREQESPPKDPPPPSPPTTASSPE